MTFVLGLTGSIGMGKSTTAELFRRFGIPVYDADQMVHDLYQRDAVEALASHFPEAIISGVVDRKILAKDVLNDPERLKLLEQIIHPMVRQRQRSFFRKAVENGVQIAVLDIPLLFETGGDTFCDAIAVVSAPSEIQKQRVLSRQDMNEEKLRAILARQIPDEEKRQRAHFIIDSQHGLVDAARQVKDILRCLSGRYGRRKILKGE